jgi:HD-GYP domain-containing protein (c-di-GMP phosphodiesterase class II)
MSRDFLKKVWNLIYEEAEGEAPGGKKAGVDQKAATELNLADVGFIFGAAIDLLEGHTFGHAQRVAYIAQELAVGLELDAEDVLDVTLASLFHDVGLFKITHELTEITSSPESELLVNHPLDAIEDLATHVRKGSIEKVSELLIQHVTDGSAILEELPLPPSVATLVHGHHERYDGHGYPAGQRGDDIPVVQRIMTAADSLETAIASAGERGHSPEFVRSESMKLSGKQLGPAEAKVLVDITQNVRFWGIFTGGQVGKQLLSRIPQEKLSVTYGQLSALFSTLVGLVDGKSPYRQNHSWNVARNAYLISLELGMSEDLATSLGMAGMIHDLGKAGVSNQVLDKPKWLTGPEYEQAKKHIDYTKKIISYAGSLFDETVAWIDDHHERLDGSGYPNRLKEEKLSREVRILSTADVYDALISDRPYRRGLDPVAAVRFMEGKVNRYFDPEVLGALGAVVEASTQG